MNKPQNQPPSKQPPRVTNSVFGDAGHELRRIRLGAELKIFDVAQHLEVSSASVSAWETGRRTIPENKFEEIQEFFGLSTAELQALKQAARVDKDKIVIKVENRGARRLALLLRRKINWLSSKSIDEVIELIEKSKKAECSTKFKWMKIDFEVPELTREQVERKAALLRSGLRTNPREGFDIVKFYEFKLGRLFCDEFGDEFDGLIGFEVLEDSELGAGVNGRAGLFPPKIELSNSTYEAAMADDYYARWVMAHELGHIWLLHGIDAKDPIKAFRAPRVKVPTYSKYYREGDLPSLKSAEWQANQFAAELLMPREECTSMIPIQIQSAYRVSNTMASQRLRSLRSNYSN